MRQAVHEAILASRGSRKVAIAYRIDMRTRTVHTTCTGAVTLPEVLAHFDALEADPHAHGPLDVILDLTRTTTLPDAGQLRSVAARIGSTAPIEFGTLAIVAASDALFGSARMLEVFAQDSFRAIRVFRELAQAKAWLETEQRAGKPNG